MAIVFTQSIFGAVQHDLATGQWSPTTRRFFDELVTSLNALLAAVPVTTMAHEGDVIRAMTQGPATSEDVAQLQARVAALEVRLERLVADLGN